MASHPSYWAARLEMRCTRSEGSGSRTWAWLGLCRNCPRTSNMIGLLFWVGIERLRPLGLALVRDRLATDADIIGLEAPQRFHDAALQFAALPHRAKNLAGMAAAGGVE